jgi:DNA-directed RNA polymerase alpha subunit
LFSNYLRNMGVNTLKELLNKSDDDLLNHSKMTNKTLNSIIKTLLKSGYELKDAT